MRVLFISDFTLEDNSGGAQVSNKILIDKGRELGYEIKEHNYRSSATDFLSSYDLVINSNLALINRITPEKMPLILRMPNSVRLEHDSCSYLSDDIRRQLFANAKKNFFLSQYHLEFFQKLYGDYFHDVEINYDPIDTSLFTKSEDSKEYDVVYCGYLHQLKGFDKLLDFAKTNPNRQVDVFGWAASGISADHFFKDIENIKYHGLLPHNEVAGVFKKSKALFHSPIVNEPFCRMVCEALLCGVEEIIGDTSKIGAYLEFKKVGYEKFKNDCQGAAEKFWREANSS